jgi:hypothetical protein
MPEGEEGRFPARVEFYEEAMSDTALDWRLAAGQFFKDRIGVSVPFQADQHGYTIGFETKEDRRLLYEFLAAHGDEDIRLAGPSQDARGFGPVYPLGVPKEGERPEITDDETRSQSVLEGMMRLDALADEADEEWKRNRGVDPEP